MEVILIYFNTFETCLETIQFTYLLVPHTSGLFFEVGVEVTGVDVPILALEYGKQ